MKNLKKLPKLALLLIAGTLIFTSCKKEENTVPDTSVKKEYSFANYSGLVDFTKSQSKDGAKVYEILPGPSVINPAMDPTPFSDNIQTSTGSYSFEVIDKSAEDSENSLDEVKSVNILFTGSDGTPYLIDKIKIIHKPNGAGDHTFFGGVGLNKVMHGNTGIGTNLMPKMLAYITFWGITDLKNAQTGEVIAQNRVVHIMSATNVRDENLKLITSVDEDKSDHDMKNVQTHVILPPLDMQGNMDPVPGTAHGFLHMMFENVVLSQGQRDWKLAYEILPGPSVINPQMNPTPFSDKIGVGAGTYTLRVSDLSEEDSESSKDAIEDFSLTYQRQNGEMFKINNIKVIHKAPGTGDHSFFGGVGLDKVMHGNTGIGVGLMPKMTAYITLWGTADLLDGKGNVLAENRVIHIMVAARVRDDNLNLNPSVDKDLSDKSPDKIETHVILPPLDMQGNLDPVPGTGHGFLHLMFEGVNLESK